jgi:two-component system response regulator FixJ
MTHPPAAAPSDEKRDDPARDATRRRPSRRPTVALLDPEPEAVRAATALLKTRGVNVMPFPTAPALLDALEHRPLCAILIDAATPDVNVLDLPRTVADRSLPLPVIILARDASVSLAVRALQAGAADFVEKPLQGRVLGDGVRRAVEMHKRWQKNLQERDRARQLLTRLTPREVEVWTVLAQGPPSWQAAKDLLITPNTLDIYRMRIKDKMEAATSAQLARYYLLFHTAPLGLAYLGT